MDQRVQKVCETLHKEGYDILLIGRKLSHSNDFLRPYPVKRMKLMFKNGPLFYAEFNIRLFFLLLFKKADIFLANDLDTLLANFIVSELRGKKLVYDSHEYFTEVPELEGRGAKRVWSKIEKFIFPKLSNVYTVGEKLANIYSAKYKVKVDFIRNLPRIETREKGEEKYLLYQGAINEGRGLKQLIDAMEFIDLPLKIIGDGDIKEELLTHIENKGLSSKVEMIDRKDPEALKEFTRNAIIGFNLLESRSLNYVYSLANKFFDYIQFEVPVITMNFSEYDAIFSKFRVGEMIRDLDPETIKSAVDNILSPENRTRINANLKKAKEEFVWENEEQKLISIYSNLEE